MSRCFKKLVSPATDRVSTEDRCIRWLLEGDPAVRWQTVGDLVGAPKRAVEHERNKVARHGWGARLLARQDAEGTWSGGLSSDGGLYSPKWTSTTYTMLLLRDLGLGPNNRQARKACALLLDRGLQRDGGIGYGRRGGSETCITGMVLSILAYFRCHDSRLDTIAKHLLTAQMADGGWNCRRSRGATHSSLHTTISVLEGLHHLERHLESHVDALRIAQRRGREFLLLHRLFRSHRTGNIIKSDFTRFVFPARWHYDILRALDYFQAVDAPRVLVSPKPSTSSALAGTQMVAGHWSTRTKGRRTSNLNVSECRVAGTRSERYGC